MAPFSFLSLFLLPIALFVTLSSAADPFAFFNFEVSYITASPLGVPQQVCFLWILFPSSIFFPVLGGLFSLMADGFVLDFKNAWIFSSRSSS